MKQILIILVFLAALRGEPIITSEVAYSCIEAFIHPSTALSILGVKVHFSDSMKENFLFMVTIFQLNESRVDEVYQVAQEFKKMIPDKFALIVTAEWLEELIKKNLTISNLEDKFPNLNRMYRRFPEPKKLELFMENFLSLAIDDIDYMNIRVSVMLKKILCSVNEMLIKRAFNRWNFREVSKLSFSSMVYQKSDLTKKTYYDVWAHIANSVPQRSYLAKLLFILETYRIRFVLMSSNFNLGDHAYCFKSILEEIRQKFQDLHEKTHRDYFIPDVSFKFFENPDEILSISDTLTVYDVDIIRYLYQRIEIEVKKQRSFFSWLWYSVKEFKSYNYQDNSGQTFLNFVVEVLLQGKREFGNSEKIIIKLSRKLFLDRFALKYHSLIRDFVKQKYRDEDFQRWDQIIENLRAITSITNPDNLTSLPLN